MDHPYLVVYSTSGANAAAAQHAIAATASASEAPAGAEEDALNGGMCGVCHDPLEQPVVASCGHAFCRVCLPLAGQDMHVNPTHVGKHCSSGG